MCAVAHLAQNLPNVRMMRLASWDGHQRNYFGLGGVVEDEKGPVQWVLPKLERLYVGFTSRRTKDVDGSLWPVDGCPKLKVSSSHVCMCVFCLVLE